MCSKHRKNEGGGDVVAKKVPPSENECKISKSVLQYISRKKTSG